MKGIGQAEQRSAHSPPPRVPSGGAGSAGEARQTKMPPSRTWMWFAVVLLVNYMIMSLLMPDPDAPVTVPYTLFKEEVAKRNVEAIHTRGETMTGRFKTPVTLPLTEREKAAAEAAAENADRGGLSRVTAAGNTEPRRGPSAPAAKPPRAGTLSRGVGRAPRRRSRREREH